MHWPSDAPTCLPRGSGTSKSITAAVAGCSGPRAAQSCCSCCSCCQDPGTQTSTWRGRAPSTGFAASPSKDAGKGPSWIPAMDDQGFQGSAGPHVVYLPGQRDGPSQVAFPGRKRLTLAMPTPNRTTYAGLQNAIAPHARRILEQSWHHGRRV